MGRAWALAVLVLALAGAGCSALPWVGGGAVVEEAGPVPIGPSTVVDAVAVTSGRWRLETFASDRGPCVELVEPGGARQPRCVAGAGLGDDHGPAMVVDVVDTAMRLDDLDVEWLASGLTRPDVRRVQLHVGEDAALEEVELVDLPASGVRAFLAAVPPGVRRFELRAYDADGCLVQTDRHELEPRRVSAATQVPGVPDCDRRPADTS